MLRKSLLFHSIIVLLFSFSLLINAQSIKPYIGINGGINFTRAQVLGSYDIITLLNGEALDGSQYDPLFRNFGYHFGFSGLGIPAPIHIR